MKRTILILGGGVMQLPPIRAARRLGLHVVVADGNPQAVGIPEADEFLPIDLRDADAMASAAARLKERSGLDAVFTAGTDFSSTVAFVAERLGLPGTAYEAALNATDKFRMRRVLREAGVRVPDFTVLDADEINSSVFDDRVRAMELPVVVKPVDSMGARGVVRADSWGEVRSFAHAAATFSRSGRVVIERYIDGPEFSIDAIVYDGEVQITGFADRHIAFPPYFIEMGHTIPTVLPSARREVVIAEFIRAVRALGIGPGAAKGDVKLSSEGPVIGEVAARLSGGYMSGWTYPLSSGVPLSEIGIRVALGEPAPRVKPRWNRTSAERAIISIPGVLASLSGVDDARKASGVEEIFIARTAGSKVTFPRNNVEKVGNVIAVAETRAEAVSIAEHAVRVIEPRLKPCVGETDRFLFSDPREPSLPPEYRHFAFSAPGRVGSLLDTWTELCARADRLDPRSIGLVLDRCARELDEVIARTNDRTIDWAYRTPADIVAAVKSSGLPSATSPTLRPPDPGTLACLTRAFAKGGLQGLRYAIDSLVVCGLPVPT